MLTRLLGTRARAVADSKDVKDVVTDPDPASNPADDAMIAVLEDPPG
jgi:hypothetical protein